MPDRRSRIRPHLGALVTAIGLLVGPIVHAQPADAWSNVPAAPDDRFTNPKSKLYAGPDGWYNFGEVRAATGTGAAPEVPGSYAFKGGLHYMETPASFVLVDPKRQTRVLMLSFGGDKPAPGDYQVATRADPAQKLVAVSFSEIVGDKVLAWSGAGKAGVITVSLINGFRHFRARNLLLAPTGPGNAGELKKPLSLSLEGAVAPD